MLGKMTALEAVFHPELHGSGIALSDLEVLEHSAVQKVADTSQDVRAQISMVEGSEEIFSEFDFAFAFNLATQNQRSIRFRASWARVYSRARASAARYSWAAAERSPCFSSNWPRV